MKKKNFITIDNLNLKRGFITGYVKNNKDYLLKYQPNKSLMELVINCYLKSLNINNFLIPNLFVINNDNSYFYIIEKYNTDLYKFFSILEKNNKILTLNNIFNITLFIIHSIEILHKNNIIHSDLKLENIVLNYDKDNNINDLKIIDFDVGLFDVIPHELTPIPEKYVKILNNKKIRGTKIYMLKNQTMSFNNDIYSLGVVSLILLYKNSKNLLSILKKSLNEKDKKKMIKIQEYIKKLNNLRDVIEDDNNKFKLLDLIESIFKKYNNLNFFDNKNNKNKLRSYKNFIIDCLKIRFNINELKEKYKDL